MGGVIVATGFASQNCASVFLGRKNAQVYFARRRLRILEYGAKAVSAAKTAEFDFGRKHFQSGVKWCPIAFRESRLSIQQTTVRGSLSTYS